MVDLTFTDEPAELGLNRERLQRVDQLLTDWTAQAKPPMPAAAFLLGREHRCIHPRWFGRMGPEPDAPPVRRDGIFLLASITKPIIYLAAMQLVEEGRLRLNDRVIHHIPEFAANHKNDVRVRDLFCHVSGLPDMLGNNTELRKARAPLEQFIKGAIQCAPLFPAGTNVSYQSMGTLIVAELIRRLTGRPVREVLRDRVFAPLGMNDTALGSDGLDADRLIRVATVTGPEASDWDWNSTYWRRLGAPWGGLFSTPTDFARFCAELLAGERRRGPLAAPRTLQAMRVNQLTLYPGLEEGCRRADAWGLGWKLNRPAGEMGALCELLGPHLFGHRGATGTTVWIDPESRLFFILFTTGPLDGAPHRMTTIANMAAAALNDG